MPAKQWPPPGFPLVKGNYALTSDWSIDLPEQFAVRVEDGSLVLRRPGLTVWLEAWKNDRAESQARRLEGIKDIASPNRFAESLTVGDGVTRYRYRILDETGEGLVESMYAFIVSDAGHLQMGFFFDDAADQVRASRLVDGVTAERRG